MKMIRFIQFSKFKYQLPIIIFIVMSLNLLMASGVYANTTIRLNGVSAWAVGVLGFTILMLVFYLLIVIFQPERF